MASYRSNFRKLWSSKLEELESRRVLAAATGSVFEDLNQDGLRDVDESGIPGVVVYLDANGNGELDRSGFGMDPDEFESGQILNNSRQTIFPSAAGLDNLPASRVRAVSITAAPTGGLVFGPDTETTWDVSRRLRFDFTVPVNAVSLDILGTGPGAQAADVQLDAYTRDGQLLQSESIDSVSAGETGRITLERSSKDVDYVVAYVVSGRGTVAFDNLRADDASDERATTTDSTGMFRLHNFPDGTTTIAQLAPTGFQQTSPAMNAAYELLIDSTITNLNFGNRTSSVSGAAFTDLGAIGIFEPAVDEPIEGMALYLDINGNGLPDQRSVSIEPDAYLQQQPLDFISPHAALRVVDANNNPTGASVIAASELGISPDGQVFTHEGEANWNNDTRLLVDFAAPASSVAFDFIAANPDGTEQGVLVAYSPSGDEIASVTSRFLGPGQSQLLSITREGNDISHAVAYTVGTEGIGSFDNLRATTISEPVAVTNSVGEYTFRPLAEGTYRVGALPVSGQEMTFPAEPIYTSTVSFGEDESDNDFGFRSTNDPPRARGDVANTVEDTPVGIGVLVNDSDPDGSVNQGTVTVTQSPANGTATVTADGQIVYTPAADFNGRDSLIYTVRDDQAAESNSAVVTINVAASNDPPVAVDDQASFNSLTPVVVGVLGNDVDVDDDLIASSLVIVSQPANGILSVDRNTGNVTYTPTFGTTDSFRYTIEDRSGATSNVATVTMMVLATSEAAPIARNESVSTREGTLTEVDILSNDTDADGTIVASSVVVVDPPIVGMVSISDAGVVAYQPVLGYVGPDSFTYVVQDNSGLVSNEATVSFEMAARDTPYQNPINSLDVNPDGAVVPQDALFIINEINDRKVSDAVTGAITVPVSNGGLPVAYYDVDGNGFVTAGDVLRVVNFINSQNSAAAEPPEIEIDPVAATAAFADGVDAFDDIFDEDEEDDELRVGE